MSERSNFNNDYRNFLAFAFLVLVLLAVYDCAGTTARMLASKPAPVPRPATFLLPRDPAVLVLLSPVDDREITTDTLAGLHRAGMLAYRKAVETELTLIAKGRKP